jgi:integrase
MCPILDCAQACGPWDYLMLRILWRTEVRVSELLSIRPQDLEPHNQVINITKVKGNKPPGYSGSRDIIPPLGLH